MKTKHTPGQWVKNNNIKDLTIRAGERGFVIAEVTSTGISHFIGNEAEAEANAKLIAHAPELLLMVYDLKNCIQRLAADNLTQIDRDKEAQWEQEAHELLSAINPDYYTNANKTKL